MIYFVRILFSYFIVTAVVNSSYHAKIPEHKKCVYGRQRKSGDDVTCYQFKGPKCAKGFFCKGGPYDTEGTCCLVNNPCYVGKPVNAENGNALSCGWVGETCPKGHYCHRDYHNNYGVCCPDMAKYFKCKYGRLMKDGIPMVCEHGNTNMTCPPDSYCLSLPGTYGVCCAASDPCSTGVPYTKDGNAVYCGHSELGERCPQGYFCKIEIPGRHEICCQAEEPKKRVRCEIGQPLPYVACSESKKCPYGYYCKTYPKDKSISSCCREPPLCPLMPGETTVTIFPPSIITQPPAPPPTTTSPPAPPPTTVTPTTTPTTKKPTKPPRKHRRRKNKPKNRNKPKGKSRKTPKVNEPGGKPKSRWEQAWEKLLIIDWN